MQNTLIDNSTDELKMSSVLKKCIVDEDFNEIMIATGYWDMPGMVLILEELKSFLNRENTKLRILIGKEPVVRIYQQQNPKPIKRDDFPKEYILKEIHDLELKEEYQAVIDLLLKNCFENETDSKIQIRIYGQGKIEQFLHAKCYIFSGNRKAFGVIGSSNFTRKGLEENAELNYLETDYTRVKFHEKGNNEIKGHKTWFEEKWNESQQWNQIFLEEILRPSPIGKKVEKKIKEEKAITEIPLSLELTPYQVYMKLLINQWGDVIDSNWKNNIESYIPSGLMKLDYQIEAVNQGFSIMKKHGGFILSDVVGLGKTIVGILTIKRFLVEAGERPRKILIVAPPAIKKSWETSIEDFDKDTDDKIANRITFITTGSIGKLFNNDVVDDSIEDDDIDTDDFEGDLIANDYGLIIIDESHKFRNSETFMYKQLDSLIANCTIQPYVMLISATPQNNKPNDLKNQIFLFQREHQNTTLDTIEGRKLDSYFKRKSDIYKDLIKATDSNGLPKSKEQLELDKAELKTISNDIREKVIEPLVIRRTRTDIERYFGKDLEQQNIRFPKIDSPTEIPYELNGKLSKLFFDTIEIIAPTTNTDELKLAFDKEGSLRYYRYRAIEFLTENHKKLYEKRNLTAETTSKRLARIMQILLVKRLESSFAAFRESLKNLQRYSQNMIDMYNDDCIFICPDFNVNAIMSDYDCTTKEQRELAYQEIRNKIKVKKGNNIEYKKTDFSPEYIIGLKADKLLIDTLYERWKEERFDPKLLKFNILLDTTFFSDKNNSNNPTEKKLVIFTEAISTVYELAESITNMGGHKVLAITSENRDLMQETIQANFDANYKGKKKNDFDIIITTDVLAEGINLHRSNVILNYDTPWNSTRLMQRLGRVNRIGSQEEFVYVFNFFPSAQGNVHIDLVNKAHTKLQSFHTMFGGDNQVFSHNEEVLVHELKRGALDDSETPFMKYIAELKQFKGNNSELYKQLEQLPDGCYASKQFDTKGLLCHVKPKEKSGLYFIVDNEQHTTEIPFLQFLQSVECSENEPSLLPMSENWQLNKDAALQAYKTYIVKITKSHDQSKAMVKAESIILKKLLSNMAKLTPETVALLKTARSLVKNGDSVLIQTIISIERDLDEKGFLNNDENKIIFIENAVNDRLKNINNQANKKLTSAPEVVLIVELKESK